jgi:hypothetical protein
MFDVRCVIMPYEKEQESNKSSIETMNNLQNPLTPPDDPNQIAKLFIEASKRLDVGLSGGIDFDIKYCGEYDNGRATEEYGIKQGMFYPELGALFSSGVCPSYDAENRMQSENLEHFFRGANPEQIAGIRKLTERIKCPSYPDAYCTIAKSGGDTVEYGSVQISINRVPANKVYFLSVSAFCYDGEVYDFDLPYDKTTQEIWLCEFLQLGNRRVHEIPPEELQQMILNSVANLADKEDKRMYSREEKVGKIMSPEEVIEQRGAVGTMCIQSYLKAKGYDPVAELEKIEQEYGNHVPREMEQFVRNLKKVIKEIEEYEQAKAEQQKHEIPEKIKKQPNPILHGIAKIFNKNKDGTEIE